MLFNFFALRRQMATPHFVKFYIANFMVLSAIIYDIFCTSEEIRVLLCNVRGVYVYVTVLLRMRSGRLAALSKLPWSCPQALHLVLWFWSSRQDRLTRQTTRRLVLALPWHWTQTVSLSVAALAVKLGAGGYGFPPFLLHFRFVFAPFRSLKAKFHYAIWFEPASNQLRTR